jgi:hypothetical protein
VSQLLFLAFKPVITPESKVSTVFDFSLTRRKSAQIQPWSRNRRTLRGVGPIRPMRPLLLAAAVFVGSAPAAWANDVTLMAGQPARSLQGRFNNVPVLHSNQPEEVAGPGILVSTTEGSAVAENGQSLQNATYTFNGEFGIHAHHKYLPLDVSRQAVSGARRAQLTLAAVAINSGNRDVTLRFNQGAVKNSFEAPYLATNMMGVHPQGARPWNTGPGAATAVQMLRGGLDRRLPEAVLVPAGSRVVLFSTALPAKGIANALLKGRSDGPFQLAVVAVEDPRTDKDIISVLDNGRLAPGRTYLSKIDDINKRKVFARVAGVAIGDAYQATVQHNLQQQGALHVPLTTTVRHNFGTGENQVNPLVSRMLDSSLDNVGTYGVRFDVDMQLQGSGPHHLMLSHPSITGRQFTAFRGSIGITTDQGYEELHVGMRSGQSLDLKTLNLSPAVTSKLRISLVYPADATPGHLLSVVSDQQLASLREREQRLDMARRAAAAAPMLVGVPPAADGSKLVTRPQPNQERVVTLPMRKTNAKGELNKPAINGKTLRAAPPLLPPTAPPILPSSGWPPGSPAMIDPTRPYQLMRNWFGR